MSGTLFGNIPEDEVFTRLEHSLANDRVLQPKRSAWIVRRIDHPIRPIQDRVLEELVDTRLQLQYDE